MGERQREMLKDIREKAGALSSEQIEYWKEYSSFNDWQLWAVIIILIVPLILLYFKIDRSKILLLGFYGLNYHIWFAYTNSIGIRLGLWEYPYELLPVLPSFALDASFVPVMFILLYQWTLNHKKNFYLYSLLLSAVFAFVIKPILVSLDFFRMFKGVNYFHLFLCYIAFFLVAKIITNIFISMQKNRAEV
ncbi:hypothetical protein ACQCVH_18050 [Bacillus infantis]|uniref:Uncharacterized protein n=1 Tax=Bacillus infantis TaxID=324767 RepID=A0A5D4SRX4_9BACI|nr:hypothetical protein [Bacillus infantis]MCP1158777.1 hypothetical protein [Bacillus infantis]RYI29548.1 hypothetical protein EVU96_11200 [Bacillus infantis]TYS64978.1 hypothetical protein FZD47_06400 [Bacillus infantis]